MNSDFIDQMDAEDIAPAYDTWSKGLEGHSTHLVRFFEASGVVRRDADCDDIEFLKRVKARVGELRMLSLKPYELYVRNFDCCFYDLHKCISDLIKQKEIRRLHLEHVNRSDMKIVYEGCASMMSAEANYVWGMRHINK